MKRYFCSTILLGLAVMLAAVSCGHREESKEPVVRPVVTMVVGEPGAGMTRTFSGKARASVEVSLSFRVGGEISELPVKTGMKVAPGSLISKLDATDYEIELKQLEAQLAQTEAQLSQARSEYERMRNLYEASSISKSDLDNAKSAFESSTAQRDATQESLRLAKQRVQYCSLKSPVDGTIASVPVEAHETVQAGQTIATVASGERIDIEVGIPSAVISELNVGDEADVRFDVFEDKEYTARVTEVGVVMSGLSTYPVKLRLDANDGKVRSGMVADVTFTFGDTGGEPGFVVVPASAVVGGAQESRYVWVFDPESGTVGRRDVNVGSLTSAGLQIRDGLKPGEYLVTRGVHRIKDGMKAKLLEQ